MSYSFTQIKERFIQILSDKSPCQPEYKKVLASQSEEELLQIIKNNISWCSSNKACPADFLSMFTGDIIDKFGIKNVGEDNTGLANTGDRNTGHWNTGDRNTGNSNTGDRNTGNSNTGHWNTGDSNTGNRNTGDSNTGNRNTGDRNTGHWNTGDRNTGDSNTGNRNTGDRNTGHWNTGDSNTGYSNTGNRNTGAFCTGEPGFPLFNKPSGWTEMDFLNSAAYHFLCQVDTKMWVQESAMTDEEKAQHPSYKTAEGYLKDIPFKEAFSNRWGNWSEESRKAFTSLPNFDAEIFEEITGVKI